MKKNVKNIKPSTIVRCVILVVVLLNQILAIFGKTLPFTSNLIYQILSVVLTVIVSVWTAWKNNDFTRFAKTAGKILDALRDGKITDEEAMQFLESADSMLLSDECNDETEENNENIIETQL